MSYTVKEIYYTLQGEGMNTGRAAVFCRFAGCNLWSGREQDRSQAICDFCDTDFVGTDGPGGGKFERARDLSRAIRRAWPAESVGRGPMVVCTGGEPLLQMDQEFVDALHADGFQVAIETNGTKRPPRGIDHICVSPKAGAELVLTKGHELKLIFPQVGAEPHRYEHLEFERFYLQPMDSPARDENTRRAVQYCKAHPIWRLSLQIHKYLGIP